MSKGGPRVPLINVQNKKQSENNNKSFNKFMDQNSIFYFKIAVQMEDENYSNNIKSITNSNNKFNMRSVLKESNDDDAGNAEHFLCMKKALEDAIHENDDVSYCLSNHLTNIFKKFHFIIY